MIPDTKKKDRNQKKAKMHKSDICTIGTPRHFIEGKK